MRRRQIEVERRFQDDLDEGDRACQRQIHEAGGEEDGEKVEGRGGELRAAQRQLLDRDDGGEGGVFQRADGFVAERGKHRAHRLRRDDAQHHDGGRHAERLARKRLAALDGDNIAANDLGDERRFVQRERETRGLDGGELDPDQRKGVVAEDHLQDERRAAKDDGVGARDDRERPEAAQLHAGENEAHRDAAGKAERRYEKRVDDARQQIGLTEIMKKQFHRGHSRCRKRGRSGSRRAVSPTGLDFQSATTSFGASIWSMGRFHVFISSACRPDFWISVSAAMTASRKSVLLRGTAMPTE